MTIRKGSQPGARTNTVLSPGLVLELLAIAGRIPLIGWIVFMLVRLVVFVGYGLFAAAIRRHVISRPCVLVWMRRAFAGAFVALGANLALAVR